MRAKIAMGSALAMVIASPVWAKGRPEMKPIAIGSVAEWFASDDYPAEALRASRSGRVVVELGVGVDGKVTSCNVKVSSGTTLLDETTCRLAYERGKFDPATDKKGRPTAGSVIIPVRWALDEDSGPPPVALAAGKNDESWEIEVKLDEQGNTLSCKVIAKKARDESDPCARVKIGQFSGRRFTKDGYPVAVSVINRGSTEIIPAQ
ncbi:MAG: energy transducer TonB [Sphingomonadales bacterium]|nr:energy transducer TonB [Sphingomonadales bacterium]